ncbi:hypothetical protein BW730_17895 [Tessaracoccus aquimaris]|uniref:D-alanyl-D-alanine carboxypeptidase n=1 Tax=Tessaracoccus aquimaris TaxID=1332264 RepID=A0A1Q2CSH8_9ACTN|nr:D-alanyl-D-alanine carboxypeptidase [Tessaracoccus aquimaris]AQP49083.1 hypothetical protein BW730_17895 [Tessaracoccus aquimaris]
MKTRRIVEWAVTGVLATVLLVGGFVLGVFHTEAAGAVGLTREGAPTTVSQELFAAPSPDPSEPPAAGNGLVAAAPLPADGAVPKRETLEAKLKALDTSKLVGIDGAPVTISYEVLDAETGAVVASKQPTAPLIPASNTKTLTTLAVMHAFTGSETFATTVVQPAPGQIVLVGAATPCC